MISHQDLIAPLKKLAKVSQAKLAKVACFVVRDGVIISSGVNHNPTGGPMEDFVDGAWVSRPEVVHAEITAIQAATANRVDLKGTTMLLTVSPCINCAREIAKTDIGKVCYLYDWWDAAALDILHASDIATTKLLQRKEER